LGTREGGLCVGVAAEVMEVEWADSNFRASGLNDISPTGSILCSSLRERGALVVSQTYLVALARPSPSITFSFF
jgi:hypothetical protein